MRHLQNINFRVATFAGLLGRLSNTNVSSPEVLNADKYINFNQVMDQ